MKDRLALLAGPSSSAVSRRFSRRESSYPGIIRFRLLNCRRSPTLLRPGLIYPWQKNDSTTFSSTTSFKLPSRHAATPTPLLLPLLRAVGQQKRD